MTLNDIVQLVASKKGLDADTDYKQRLLSLAKQRGRQLWEAFDWPERLRAATVNVSAGSEAWQLDLQYFDSVVSVRNLDTDELLEPRTLADFHRQHKVAPAGEALSQTGPTCYALTREANADLWSLRFDAAPAAALTLQVLYRLTRRSLYENRQEESGEILVNGAELVLEAWIEADALEMDEQRGEGMQQRRLGDERLAMLKTQAKQKPGHQRIMPAVTFFDD